MEFNFELLSNNLYIFSIKNSYPSPNFNFIWASKSWKFIYVCCSLPRSYMSVSTIGDFWLIVETTWFKRSCVCLKFPFLCFILSTWAIISIKFFSPLEWDARVSLANFSLSLIRIVGFVIEFNFSVWPFSISSNNSLTWN